MLWTLGGLSRLDGRSGVDLLAHLRKREGSRRELRVASRDLEFRAEGGALVARHPGGSHRLAPSAALEVRRQAGLPSRIPTPDAETRLRRWKEELAGHLLLLEGDAVRAVLPGNATVIRNADLLATVVEAVRGLRLDVKIEECAEDEGDLTLTLVAPELAREVGVGDMVYGGLYLASSETSMLDSEACARIFRVACENGTIVDGGEGRRLVLDKREACADWRPRLERVVTNSFAGGTMDAEAARFRKTLDEILASPYELLVHLQAQGLLTDDEQERIQVEFRRADDLSLHGFINAVTRVAHVHFRGNGRRFPLERLAGEILRGDHLPPAGVPSWAG